MAMTSVSHRAQMLPVATPATAVRPVRRVVQVAAKQEGPQKSVARAGLAAAAAAALLVVGLRMLGSACKYKLQCFHLPDFAPACWCVYLTHRTIVCKVNVNAFAGVACVCAVFGPTGTKCRPALARICRYFPQPLFGCHFFHAWLRHACMKASYGGH